MERLVLLPGLLCDETVWVSQREALAGRAAVFVPQYHDIDTLAGMAAKVLRDAPYDTFSLAGHSMGGRVAMEVVRQAPQRVQRLALLDTGCDPLPDGQAGETERSVRRNFVNIAREKGLREMAKVWASGMVHPDLQGTPIHEAVLDMLARRTLAEYEAQINALLTRPDARPVLQALRCPVSFICGRQDRWSTYEHHETMSRLTPPHLTTLAAVEHCGHMATMERPQAVSDLLAQWLDTPAA